MIVQEIIFSDLYEIVQNKQEVLPYCNETKWQSIPYTAEDIEGKILAAGEYTHPEELTLTPNLKGWYKIFLGLIQIGSENHFYIKLSNEEWYRSVRMSKEPRPIHFETHEWIEENFWCCADLTNQNVHIKKPEVEGKFGISSSIIAYIRCVPMTDREVKAYQDYQKPQQKLHVHFDCDWNLVEEQSVSGAMSRLCTIKDTDAKLCSVEITGDLDNNFAFTEAAFTVQDESYRAGNEKAYAKRFMRHKTYTDFIRKQNIIPLAAMRMSICNFGIPYDKLLQLRFPKEHPEFYIKSREGNTIPICSYAYPEVQNYVISSFKTALDYGYDGVTLMYVRGSHIGFEQPVLDAFSKLYPDVNPCRLPVTDKRLNGIWREIFTTFMTKLRTELDAHAKKHIHINIVTDFTPDTDFCYGIDIEKWAELGLIDSVCSDTMETYEDLTNCLADDGLIDLEKYKAEQKKRMVVCRNYDGLDIDHVVEGVHKYLEIEKKYGTEFYACLLGYWRPSIYVPNWEKVKEAGATRFCATNFTHAVPDLPGYHRVSKFGHDTLNAEYHTPRLLRVLSLNGIDISTYNPNWRG